VVLILRGEGVVVSREGSEGGITGRPLNEEEAAGLLIFVMLWVLVARVVWDLSSLERKVVLYARRAGMLVEDVELK